MKSTKSKTTKKQKENKTTKRRNIIIVSCAAILAIVLIIITIVANQPKPLDDSFFVSDNTKYVLNLGVGDIEYEDDAYSPIETHLVYFYSGDDITGLKVYYEYANAEDATAAHEQLVSENSDSYKEILRNDKFVILVANEADYEDVKASDVKKQIDFMDMINNMRNAEDDSVEE